MRRCSIAALAALLCVLPWQEVASEPSLLERFRNRALESFVPQASLASTSSSGESYSFNDFGKLHLGFEVLPGYLLRYREHRKLDLNGTILNETKSFKNLSPALGLGLVYRQQITPRDAVIIRGSYRRFQREVDGNEFGFDEEGSHSFGIESADLSLNWRGRFSEDYYLEFGIGVAATGRDNHTFILNGNLYDLKVEDGVSPLVTMGLGYESRSGGLERSGYWSLGLRLFAMPRSTMDAIQTVEPTPGARVGYITSATYGIELTFSIGGF